GEFCLEEEDCESGLCYDSTCLNPDSDYDGDGLRNGIEKNITGTDYGLADTDGDGVADGVEVGASPSSPTDTDGDGIHDALESLAPTADPDKDCIPDQYDPDNDKPDVDSVKVADLHCSRKGVCGDSFDKVTATCDAGEPVCDYSGTDNWEAAEASCDGKDNDCDGKTDEELVAPDQPACLTAGVCAGNESAIFRLCKAGTWQCEYSRVPDFEGIESSCDGVDNNCDGDTDEGLIAQECFNRNEYGKCPGLTVCTIYEGVSCEGPQPMAEICNGVDDNCNGSTDENLTGQECVRENEYGTCGGFTVCDAMTGGTDCSAPLPAPETCDSIDNDCDGDTDEEAICDRVATLKVVVHGALLPQLTLKATGRNGVPGYEPVPGATVRFYKDACPISETETVEPAWTGTTAADGIVLMPVQTGLWCIRVEADGYQTLQSQQVQAEASDYIPLNLVLLLNGMTGSQLSVCGRVLEMPDMTQEPSGSNDVPVTMTPIPNALVTLTGVTAQNEIASTVSDDNGFWCLYGLPEIPVDGLVTITGTKELYHQSGYNFMIERNVLYFQILTLSKMDMTETECLFESFEQAPELSQWTVEDTLNPIATWQTLTSGKCIAQGYILGCVTPYENESLEPVAGPLLCADTPVWQNGCIPETGSLPTAFSGNGFAWFGNLKTCSYADVMTGCDSPSVRVGGSLVSPWINGFGAWALYMTFRSAWEVESNGKETDIMYVEAQTSPMSETGTWAQVGLIKEMVPETPLLVHRATAFPAFTSGGVGSGPVWQQYRVDLSAFGGEFFRVRFRFDSMDGVNNYLRGWQIDDVSIRGIGCGQPAMN
ncbi:MAG TPA: MopE-related protein, partial [Myxococcota bacterium]|nr:MopE-related protein [Myxococcota bacterium]